MHVNINIFDFCFFVFSLNTVKYNVNNNPNKQFFVF